MIVPLQIRVGMLIEFTYTNHREITALRKAVVVEFVFGSSPWHPDAQMIMMGFDIEKKELREFATKDMLAVRRLDHL